MTKPKWVVKKRPQMEIRRNIWGETWEVQAKPWVAQPYKRSHKQQRFDTHAEALAWADKQARKVEVVLPRVEKSKCIDSTMSPAIFVDKTPGGYGIFLGHRHMLTVTAKELKPLGEHLLALYYEKEMNNG